jgi:hypothetical protein
VLVRAQQDKSKDLQEQRDAAIAQHREDRRLLFAAKKEDAERMKLVKVARKRAAMNASSLRDLRMETLKVCTTPARGGFPRHPCDACMRCRLPVCV